MHGLDHQSCDDQKRPRHGYAAQRSEAGGGGGSWVHEESRCSKAGIPFGHDECLSQNEPYCEGWCNNSTFQGDCCSDMSNANLREGR